VIAADGTAGLCCLDYDLKARLGRVQDQTLAEIWRSTAIQSYRRRMLAGRCRDIDVCKDCNAHIFQDRSTWAKLQR
jgi:radical SAM protein with 4Fe4S-binding SPASM domain